MDAYEARFQCLNLAIGEAATNNWRTATSAEEILQTANAYANFVLQNKMPQVSDRLTEAPPADLTDKQIQKITKSFYYFTKYLKVDQNIGAPGKSDFEWGRDYNTVLTKFNTSNVSTFQAERLRGVTTFGSAYALWSAMFSSNQNIIYLTTGIPVVTAVSNSVKAMYHALPENIKSCTSDCVQKMTFEGGSTLRFETSNTIIGRGQNIDLLIIDNAAYIDQRTMEMTWNNLYPRICENSGRILLMNTGMTGWKNTVFEDLIKNQY